jgi:uncharacterized LabA/DUF88 family protein
MHEFMPKDVTCGLCRGTEVRHEEKRTDVALAVGLVEAILDDATDGCVLVTGDTDQVPALEFARRIRPRVARPPEYEPLPA